MSGFFDSSSLPREAEQFINDSGYQLIFRDDLHLLSTYVTRGAKKRPSDYRQYRDLLIKMASTCKGLINEGYMQNVFIKTTTEKFEVNVNYDIVIILKGTEKKDIMPLNIVGMVITEKGECRSHPNIHVLNLLCTKGPTGSPIGRILMFVYVYTCMIKRLPLGLLELAGCYENKKGLCLYNKFGFREDISMKEQGCFPGDDTLAMYVDIRDREMSEENMLDALINSYDIPVLYDAPEPLCQKGSIIGPGGKYQPEGIIDRMDNFDNIMKARLNPSTVLRINKIPVREGESIKNMIKKLAKKSKDGELIIMPGKSDYTRRKTPSPPSAPPPVRKGKKKAGPFLSQSRPVVRPQVRQAVSSTATRKAKPAVPGNASRKTQGKKYYKKSRTMTKSEINDFLIKTYGYR